MTRIFVDEREISVPMEAISLDQILKHVEDEHLPPDSIIRQIEIDGLPLITDDFPENNSRLLDQVDKQSKVVMLTGTIAEIARDSIVEALGYLDRVETATRALARSFRTSPGPESSENLKQLCEGFYWLNVLLDKLKTDFRMTLEDDFIQGARASEHHQKLTSIPKQLTAADDRGDSGLISSLLECEILPRVTTWREMFDVMLKKISGTG